jgi:hypothetical protein
VSSSLGPQVNANGAVLIGTGWVSVSVVYVGVNSANMLSFVPEALNKIVVPEMPTVPVPDAVWVKFGREYCVYVPAPVAFTQKRPRKFPLDAVVARE